MELSADYNATKNRMAQDTFLASELAIGGLLPRVRHAQVQDAGYGRVQDHIVGVGSTRLRAPELQVGCGPHPWTYVVFIVPLSQLSDADETPTRRSVDPQPPDQASDNKFNRFTKFSHPAPRAE